MGIEPAGKKIPLRRPVVDVDRTADSINDERGSPPRLQNVRGLTKSGWSRSVERSFCGRLKVPHLRRRARGDC